MMKQLICLHLISLSMIVVYGQRMPLYRGGQVDLPVGFGTGSAKFRAEPDGENSPEMLVNVYCSFSKELNKCFNVPRCHYKN